MFTFTAIDFETTGSVEGYPVDPWQIGVVRVEPEAFSHWESLIQVGPRPFHPRAPGRHQAIRAELAVAPSREELIPDIRNWCMGVPLVGHNVATEQKCLRDIAPMEKLGPWIDTLKLTRAAYPDLPSHRLEDVLHSLCLTEKVETLIPGRGAHDALYDAAGSAVLLQFLLQQPGWDQVSLHTLCHPDTRPFYQRNR